MQVLFDENIKSSFFDEKPDTYTTNKKKSNTLSSIVSNSGIKDKNLSTVDIDRIMSQMDGDTLLWE